MRKLEKGFAPILILLAIILIGAVAVVGYKLLPKPSGVEYIKSLFVYPRPTPTPTPEPGCHYEQVECFTTPCPPVLRCPSKEKGSAETTDWKTYKNSLVVGFSLKYPYDWKVKNENTTNPIFFNGRDTIKMDIHDYSKLETVELGGGEVSTTEEAVIGGIKVKKSINYKELTGNQNMMLFHLQPKNKIYIIITAYSDDKEFKLINEILSTFKFTP